MPKHYTFPTFYDDALQINISNLKESNFLEPEQIKKGSLTWSRNGHRTGEISMTVSTRAEQRYIELDYKYKDEARKYKVGLVSVPSNLGKGLIWYFLCPETKKRCRILYLVEGNFLHREAFKGCMYEIQTKSKAHRQMYKTLDIYFRKDDLYKQLNQKHFKKTYAGKPTKKYLRILEQIQRSKRISHHEIEYLMMS